MSSNSPSGVLSWAINALVESEITKEEHDKLLEKAKEVIKEGGWRGDVCDRWREMGYDGGTIKDWYP